MADSTAGKKLIITSKIFSLEASCFLDFENGRSKSVPPSTKLATFNGTAFSSWGRSYSEGVFVERDCSQCRCRFKSYVQYTSERHYKETVVFQRKLVPHSFHTALTVSGDGVGVVTKELAEEARPPACFHYFEQVCFKNKMVINRRAETVYNFPGEAHRRTVAKTTYHQDRKKRNYVSGMRMSTPSNRMLVELAPLPAEAESASASANGDARRHSAGADPPKQTDIRNGHADTADTAKMVYSSMEKMEIS